MEKKRQFWNQEHCKIKGTHVNINSQLHIQKIHMKHNWLCKNLSDIGKIQQTHVPGTSIIFFTITDSNNTNTHIKTLNNT